ncbi:hypothetical protein SAY87_006212 [Trapa incisa]|uniref:Uncharacterized protein n=1 Tax=Trapa incisa TaxID=236973 RepID=A0AAN7K7C1_9MYRT|nr:hypothetical protein SAY87_006212 [Trapa incisa]
MAMKLVELFLAGEEDEFGFDLLPVEAEDLALSQWELVDPSDANSDGSDPVTDVEPSSGITNVLPTIFVSASSASGSPFPDITDQRFDRTGDPTPSIHRLMLEILEYRERLRSHGSSDDAEDSSGVSRENENENDDVEEDDGLDDELVPRNLSGKLGRQRMRKLGKRACSKMNTSKRSPYLYVKPGCLYGKHGLGLKHSV